MTDEEFLHRAGFIKHGDGLYRHMLAKMTVTCRFGGWSCYVGVVSEHGDTAEEAIEAARKVVADMAAELKFVKVKRGRR